VNKVNDLTNKTMAVMRRQNVTGGAGNVEDEMCQEGDTEGSSSRRAVAPRVLDAFALTEQYWILEKL
jgi:hypothetical protein